MSRHTRVVTKEQRAIRRRLARIQQRKGFTVSMERKPGQRVEPIISMADHINLAMKEVQLALDSFTYPVFINAANERPDLIASSVILQRKSKYYLVTAAHVLNDVKAANSPFYIGTDGAFLALEGEFIRSTHEKKDHFDIAVLELNGKFIEENRLSYVPENKTMNGRSFERVHLSCVHGYPCSKNKQVSALMGGTKFKSYGFAYSGKIDKEFSDWKPYGKHPEFHTPMNYGKAVDVDGKITTPPKPKGMSGGGLWLLPSSFKPSEVYLEGIFIEYYEKSSISFSTKINKVINFIDQYA